MLYLLGNEVHIATIRGDVSTLERLIRTESLELPGCSFRSAPHAAAEIGCQKTVLWLLCQGAKINFSSGNSLQAAVEQGHEEVVRLLLDAGADATLPTGEYGGILVTAVFLRRLIIVDLLIKNNPTLLRQRSAFGSVLDIAVCRKDGNKQMLLSLVRAGTDIIPIDRAVICRHQKNVKTLLELGAPFVEGLKLAIQRKLYRIARLILGFEPNSLVAVTTYQWSPQICAAQNDDFRMVLLILRKVQPSFRAILLERTETRRGLTALDCARRAGFDRTAPLLEKAFEHRHASQVIYRLKGTRI